ncbi:MAG: A/G-specific adenine glycosylase [Candidatus Omnitrophota bacterium]
MEKIPEPDAAPFSRSLLVWYRHHARKLPWRRTQDPYRIWISEIMLQQTQVETVIPYYLRWLKRFPNLASLAKASRHDVLRAWAGLGYYRRARMIHETARLLVRQEEKNLPASVDALKKLPGIGRYTAAAIASIAFGIPVAVLDGNVIRVLTRLCAISSDIRKARTLEKLWQTAQALLPPKQPGDFNQAMMELGATVCRPGIPLCALCPVRRFCRSEKAGAAASLPFQGMRTRIESKRTAALLLRDPKKIWLEKQPQDARWGDLWTLPYWETLPAMKRALGPCAEKMKKLFSVRHGFTKYQITLEIFEAPAEIRPAPPSDRKWRQVPIGALHRYAFPSPHKKILERLFPEWLKKKSHEPAKTDS